MWTPWGLSAERSHRRDTIGPGFLDEAAFGPVVESGGQVEWFHIAGRDS